MNTDIKPGFYHLYSKGEAAVLVHGYNCTDLGGAFVFGFNTHDGGGLIPLSDVLPSTEIVPVQIEEVF